MPMRWRCPPEKVGISPQVIGTQAHADEQLLDAIFEFSPRCDLVDDEGFGNMSKTVMRGLSDEKGSWKICIAVLGGGF